MTPDKDIAEKLREKYQTLLQEGKLLSREQLANYYTTFRRRFGPDKLKSLDGQELLETMHSRGTKDSLVYWLEFKNDDEFPSTRFGSIAGGSAHKFGLFNKKETGQWITGSPQKEQILSLEQAIKKAKLQRDQLIRGAELLEQLSADSSDEVYAPLQMNMQEASPDVNDSAWGHKYFSLLYPEKLDDFHNPSYQRFHLIKLLQLPPQGEGRYLVAGRFVAFAQLLNMPMNSLTTILNDRDGGNPYSYWRIGTTGGADSKDFWPLMQEDKCVAIGWRAAGDISKITNDTKGKDDIKSKLHTNDPTLAPIAVGKAAQQLFNFRWRIATGDLVLASNGATVLGVGRVNGGYSFDPSSDFPHRLPVEWLSHDQWQQHDQHPDIEGKLTTVYRMQRDGNLLEAEKRIYRPCPPGEPSNGNPPPEPIPTQIQSILERKGQVILYGPPGTGKTYWAEKAATELASRANYGRVFDDLGNEQKAEITGNNGQTQGFVRLCSFHPAYGYEDFLEGFRPKAVNGQMYFVLRDGIFKTLCGDAQKQPNKKFYLIIDEINRGDIPRIFGELLTVLEKNKRGKEILLPLTGKAFSVPDNVYVIGTMNTADRSIALLDTALRRRFGFLELMPNIEVFGNAAVDSIPLGPWLEALNERILEFVGHDARNLQLGHSYLLEGEHPIKDFTTFARVVQEDIFPLLEEYCYEDYTKLENILGSKLVDSKKQQFR
ncbi:MAG TPA: AAA family ATPase [Ktedonobacteraceae bacterium]|nr:AAA family ATPase [Ktedonobacteraceae bacterium]